MSLVTRCPRCRTLFRVTPAQLQARDGKVRCGRCMNAFDGFAGLATEDVSAGGDGTLDTAASRASIEAQNERPDLAHEAFEAERAAAAFDTHAEDARASTTLAARNAEPASAPAKFDVPNDEPAAVGTADIAKAETEGPPAPIADVAAAGAAMQDSSTSNAAPGESAPAKASEARNAAPAAAARAPDAAPRWTRPETEPAPEPFLVPKRRHAGWWTGGCVVLVLALALQIAYAYRGDIAARFPAAKPALIAFCEATRCSVALPQRPELVKIEASDVHMIDANRPALIQLTATLRSYAAYDLAYPALDLVLTNANEHALVRRIFLPHEYVGAGRDPHSGIPPNAEITVALELDTGDLDAAGFRLDLRPAPTL